MTMFLIFAGVVVYGTVLLIVAAVCGFNDDC